MIRAAPGAAADRPQDADYLKALGVTEVAERSLFSSPREVGLAEAIPLAGRLLEGKVRGRIVVDVNR